MTPAQQAIIAGAEQAGVDPTMALAVAERESGFNPNARSSKTIAGAFQMSQGLRQRYGVGDSTDIGQQTQGWSKFFRQNKYDMGQVLGRPPTDEEGYLGHFYGSTRAARMLKMDSSTPVDQVFTPNERAQNPEFDKAGTVGALNSSVLADVKARHSKYQDAVPDFSDEAGAPAKPDFSDQGIATGAGAAVQDAAPAPDFSQFGTPADNPMTVPQPVQLGIRG